MAYAVNTILPSILSPAFNSAKNGRISAGEMSTGKVAAENNLVKFVGERRISDNISQLESLKPGIKNAQGMLNTGINSANIIKGYLTKLTDLIQQVNGDQRLAGSSNSAYQSTIERIEGVINNTNFNKGVPLFKGGIVQAGLPGLTKTEAGEVAALAVPKAALTVEQTDFAAFDELVDRVKILQNNFTSTVATTFGGRINGVITRGLGDAVDTLKNKTAVIKYGADFLAKAAEIKGTNELKTSDIDKLNELLVQYKTAIRVLGNGITTVTATSAVTHTVPLAGGVPAADLLAGLGHGHAITIAAGAAGIGGVVANANLSAQINALADDAAAGNWDVGFGNGVVADLMTTKKAALQTAETDWETEKAAHPRGIVAINGLSYKTNAINAQDVIPVDKATIMSTRISTSPSVSDSFSVIIPSLEYMVRDYGAANGTTNDGLKGSAITEDTRGNNNILEQKITRMIEFMDNSIAYMSDQLSNLSVVENGIVSDIGSLEGTRTGYLVEYTTASAELQQSIMQERIAENMAKVGTMLAKRVLEQVENVAAAAA